MKILKRTILGILFAFVLFWFGSIAVCEYNTYKYGEIFRNIKIHDISGERYLKDEKVKILKYHKDSAEVYAVWEGGVGSIYYFKRDNSNNWMFDYWDGIWSKTGNADGFVWPYIR
ncbi:MAG: hypothetical protein ACI3XA_02620 [Clostridia bacterium]